AGLRQSENTIVEALKADLSQLQAAVQNTSRRSTDGIEEVHDTIDKVVERLVRLEAATRAGTARSLVAAPIMSRPGSVPAPVAELPPGVAAAQRLRGLGPIDSAGDRPIEPAAWHPAKPGD